MKFLIALILIGLNPFYANAKQESFQVDLEKSKVSWEGRKITGSHHGHLQLKNGKLNSKNGKLTSGSFELDMSSIVVEDITDKEQNAKLTGHLKSEDFFSTEKNPVASFKITKVEQKAGEEAMITGDLTIKGITNKISFPAHVKSEKNSLNAAAKIQVDRTKWDIKYRSGKFFPDLGDKVIKDEFTVEVNLQAKQ